MRKSIIAVIATLGLVVSAHARDAIDNGNLLVKPSKNDTFAMEGYVMGKAELFGYIGDLKDRNKITGIVLRDAKRATPEQKHVLVVTAQAQHIDAFEESDGQLIPLVDPLAKPAGAAAPAAAAQ